MAQAVADWLKAGVGPTDPSREQAFAELARGMQEE